MGRISEQLPEILPKRGHLGDMGTSAKQAGNILPDLRGSERRFKWPARRNASTCIEGIINEKLPTTGWGSLKNP